MSEKFLQRLAIENSELQKHIGCMSGMFQMFDRQRLFTGRRRSGCSNKNVPPGHILDSRNLGSDQGTCSPETILEKNLSKNFSTESSKTSVSSSSYSSFYSGDCIKPTQEETPSVDQSFYGERSTNNPTRSKNFESDAKAAYRKPQIQPAKAPTHYGRQSLDLRVVVKHSMNKNGQDLPLKETLIREEMRYCSSEQEDSPKSTRLSKFKDASQRTRIKENLQIAVQKIKKAPNYVIEANESPRKMHCLINASNPISRGSPRFSLDGRESFSTLNSQDSSTPFSKHRERPRLSLDSRIGSLRSFNFDSKPKSALENHEQSITSRRASVDSVHLQEMSHCKRSSSVVVRLMGLDTMPNLNKEQDAISKSSIDEPVTPKLRIPDPATPKLKIPDPVHTCKSMNMMFEKREARMQQESGYVYREIEERLEELELQKCNKDLRALKQIIDSMHAKETYLKNSKGGQPSTESVYNSPTVNFENSTTVSAIVSTLCKGRKTPRVFEPPKPATRISRSNLSSPSVIPSEYFTSHQRFHMSHPVNEKNSISIKTVKDPSPKHSFREPTQSVQSAMKCRKEENYLLKTSLRLPQVSASPVKSSNCASPRSKTKKIEIEKGSNLPIATSEKQLKQKTASRTPEVVSPRSRLSRRLPHAHQSKADKLNDISIKTGSLTRQGDGIFLTSGSHISLASQLKWSTNLSLPISQQDSCPSVHSSLTHMAYSCTPNEEVLTPKLPKIAAEQPSPNSVLHASTYQDELLMSPIKEFLNLFTDDNTTQISITSGMVDFPSHKLKPIFSHKKLKNIERLAKKLEELNANHDLAPETDDVPSFRETQCLDNCYVYEILLASGILHEDLTCDSMGKLPMELQPSGHPINPELFLVLEQTKSPCFTKLTSIKNKSQLKSDPEKLHRKLVFDLVNELLTQKIKLSSPLPQPQLLHQSIIAKFPSGQLLLKELCAKIKLLKVKSSAASCKDDTIETVNEDKLHLLEGWNRFGTELPEIVKKIERSIFKDMIEDLIDEILPVKTAYALQASYNSVACYGATIS